MSSVAVVKPDHLGDFVLSLPAINALRAHFGNIDLMIAPEVEFLQQHFIPDIESIPLKLKHLQREGSGLTESELVDFLRGYEIVIFLRDDHVVHYAAARLDAMVCVTDSRRRAHETAIQRDAVCQIIAPYSRSDFFPNAVRAWPRQIREVGLCISAGFLANKWPLVKWHELAHLFRDQDCQIRLIGGPNEVLELKALARMLELNGKAIVVGSRDLAGFYAELESCDVIIGTDSGTLHIVSCIKPVLGIFTSSPWWRFCPYGRHHRLVTADVVCSPCVQFSTHILNACLARECSALITPSLVSEIAHLDTQNPGIKPLRTVKAITGPSHVLSLPSLVAVGRDIAARPRSATSA
ncbi:MAG: glycosyltransferase family 9 protein [Casimicrobiaceae bacterium]